MKMKCPAGAHLLQFGTVPTGSKNLWMRLCWKSWKRILLSFIELLLTPLLTAVYEVGNGVTMELEA